MANSFYDATGTLQLTKVTPVIKALFGKFALDDFGVGKAYIARISEETCVTWDDIAQDLERLAVRLKLIDKAAIEMDDEVFTHVLKVLSAYFGCTDRFNFEDDLPYDLQEEAEFEPIFELAMRFYDGHGLTTLTVEGARHFSRPLPEAFGGQGLFLGRHFKMSSFSKTCRTLGTDVDRYLNQSRTAAAGSAITNHVTRLLEGITDTAAQKTVMAIVAEQLATLARRK